MNKSITIDNAGYNLETAKMSEKEFMETFAPNDAIGRGMEPKDRERYLKDTYAIVKAAAAEQSTKPGIAKKQNADPVKD